MGSRFRLKAAVHQGLLCDPEVGEVRLEAVTSQTSYRVVVEPACSKTTRWAILIPSASRPASLGKQVQMLARPGANHVQQLLRAGIAIGIIEVRHHAFQQRVPDNHVELSALDTMDGRHGDS